MARNEVGIEVPAEVEAAAQQLGCVGGVRYVYRDGQYGRGNMPVASVGCVQPRRWRSNRFEVWRIPLGGGWVAFRSPSGNGAGLPAGAEPAADAAPEVIDAADEAAIGVGPVQELLEFLDSDRYSPESDPWLPRAQAIVEQSLNALLDEFLATPYLHRVEHSIHAELFRMLVAHDELGQRVPIGSSGELTRLVHKEWPESVGRSGRRRGNFDLAVLTPSQLRGCESVDAFRQGLLQAPIVIELGLDYPASHLASDALKLINSRPTYGYLVHFSRQTPRDDGPEGVERIAAELEAKTGIKVLYASIDGGVRVFKRLNEREIVVRG